MRTLIIFLFISSTAIANDISTMLSEARTLLETQFEEDSALKIYEEVIILDPKNHEALCGASYCLMQIGNRYENRSTPDEWFNRAYRYAELAHQLKPEDAESNFVLAGAIARLTQNKSASDRVKFANDILSYATKAVEIEPDHDRAWYIIGKWHQEMAGLSFWESAAIFLFYGGLEEADYSKSVEAFKKACKQRPGFVLYMYDLGLTYKAMGEHELAIEVMKKALEAKLLTRDDPWFQGQCREALESLK